MKSPSSASSPCDRTCQVGASGLCLSCNRTITEIRKWVSMAEEDRMIIMKQLSRQVSTHDCPSCNKPTYCAMEDGKSSSTCWCMTVPGAKKVDSFIIDATCLCRGCLTT